MRSSDEARGNGSWSCGPRAERQSAAAKGEEAQSDARWSRRDSGCLRERAGRKIRDWFSRRVVGWRCMTSEPEVERVCSFKQSGYGSDTCRMREPDEFDDKGLGEAGQQVVQPHQPPEAGCHGRPGSGSGSASLIAPSNHPAHIQPPIGCFRPATRLAAPLAASSSATTLPHPCLSQPIRCFFATSHIRVHSGAS
jgi:hypothetical protein